MSTTSTEKRWRVAVNGVEHDESFDDEETASTYAATRRGVRPESTAPDLTKKIAVYQKDTPRHEKAIKAGAAPKPEATPTPKPEKSDDPPKAGDPTKKK